VKMPHDVKGYSVYDVVRLVAGSPATNFQFTKFNNNGSLCDSVMMNNLGSNAAFVALPTTGTIGAGSTMMLVPAFASRGLDIKAGSIQVLASGGAVSTEFEIVGLGI
jgi:hypothetical protein